MASDREHWSRVAAEWIAWARKPNHDAFWAYRSALLDFIGRGEGEALDVGCGEGRVSSVLTSCGYRVTAVDPVRELVGAAREAGSAHGYAVATATGLPFAGGSFDVAVAYNVLMDIDDMSAALKEIARVLRPEGTLFVSIVHPVADCGRFESSDLESRFVIENPYFGRRRFEGVEERDGLRMRFAGWSQPLEAYAAALESAWLAIVSLRELVPDIAKGGAHLAHWSRIPLFLWLKVRPLSF
ncbi:MAG: class I SAM-dependent methyltransferase [Propylenella sp.]